MRNRNLLLPALACALAVLPVPANAQFKNLVPAELQIQSDPQWPGADALGLDLEESSDDQTQLRAFYRRIKVLTEKGKELATVRMSYLPDQESLVTVNARTIHADGTVIPLSGQPADLVELQEKKFRVQTIVFTLPSVEVGSILEYQVEFRTRHKIVDEPLWEVQQEYPVRKAHFSLHSYVPRDEQVTDRHGNFRGVLLYSAHLPDHAVVDYNPATNTHSLDVRDIPQAPKEDWMPPSKSLNYRVEFFYTDAVSPQNFWQHVGESWVTATEAFLKPSGKLYEIAAGMVAPSDSPEVEARKLYDAVQALDNSDFSRTRSKAERKKEKLKEIRSVEDVWNNKGGSSDEIALLYVALARAVGLTAFAAQVANRDRILFDPRDMTDSQLDDYIVILILNGKEVVLDPGQKMCPFGQLHWKHMDTTGLRMTLGTPVLFRIPDPPAAAWVKRSASLAIAADGSVKGNINVTMAGEESLYWRQSALQNDLDEVQKQFTERLLDCLPEGIHADFDQFVGLKETGGTLIATLRISGTFGSPTGKYLLLPELLFTAKHPFVTQTKRITPVDMQYPRTEQDSATYTLPEGYTVESIPQSAKAVWPDHATFSIECAGVPEPVTVKRTLAYNFTLVRPSDYGSLRDFYQKVAIADQAQLVLLRSAPEKAH
jgi:hypothetical protein